MRKKLFLPIIVIISFILCSCSFPDTSVQQEGILSVHIIDVGNADSIYIALPNGKNMMIDGGDAGSFDAISNYLDTNGVSEIEYCVATHPHNDHIGSLDNVINAYSIKNIYMSGAKTNTKAFENFLTAVKKSGAAVHKAAAGEFIFQENGLSAEILSPLPDNTLKDMNNSSVVIRLQYGNTAFLFMGDAEEPVEEALLRSGQPLKADVLKTGHHGSHTSSSLKFIEAVSPVYAVMTCGINNKYGHPSPETLKTLQKKGIESFRSDTNGTVIFHSDGSTVSVSTAK